MGCSASTEAGRVTQSSSPPIAPEPVEEEEEDDIRHEIIVTSTATSKTELDTHSTQTSSFYGFKGGGRSIGSGSDNNPRSDGSERSFTTYSTSSKDRGSSSGGKLSENDEESDFEEADFEDIDDDFVGKPSSSSKLSEKLRHSAKRGELGLTKPASEDMPQPGADLSTACAHPSEIRCARMPSRGLCRLLVVADWGIRCTQYRASGIPL